MNKNTGLTVVWSRTYRSQARDKVWLHWWKLQTIQLLSITLSSTGKLWLQRKWSWYYIKLSPKQSKERILSKTDHWILHCFVNSVQKKVLNAQPFSVVVKSNGFPVELYLSKRLFELWHECHLLLKNTTSLLLPMKVEAWHSWSAYMIHHIQVKWLNLPFKQK